MPLKAIQGYKFHDLDGDAVADGDEPGLAGWTVCVDYNDNGVFDDATEPSAVTGVGGTSTVSEQPQVGWTQTVGETTVTLRGGEEVVVGDDAERCPPVRDVAHRFCDRRTDCLAHRVPCQMQAAGLGLGRAKPSGR